MSARKVKVPKPPRKGAVVRVYSRAGNWAGKYRRVNIGATGEWWVVERGDKKEFSVRPSQVLVL